ncbi:hypothetical protein EXIGLDRAFT_481865 [Exidia glandulosa HHB12029]|uniref:Uncharacterized protein n=1 Tax=Exidia glandulosa HHB12029 TaxID=1314781 RepID=A0A165PHC8_EXIGL|nr:hypothetical protein EXIGLDRAFT_481865 [Exidia glandulosa HHB12029]
MSSGGTRRDSSGHHAPMPAHRVSSSRAQAATLHSHCHRCNLKNECRGSPDGRLGQASCSWCGCGGSPDGQLGRFSCAWCGYGGVRPLRSARATKGGVDGVRTVGGDHDDPSWRVRYSSRDLRVVDDCRNRCISMINSTGVCKTDVSPPRVHCIWHQRVAHERRIRPCNPQSPSWVLTVVTLDSDGTFAHPTEPTRPSSTIRQQPLAQLSYSDMRTMDDFWHRSSLLSALDTSTLCSTVPLSLGLHSHEARQYGDITMLARHQRIFIDVVKPFIRPGSRVGAGARVGCPTIDIAIQ